MSNLYGSPPGLVLSHARPLEELEHAPFPEKKRVFGNGSKMFHFLPKQSSQLL